MMRNRHGGVMGLAGALGVVMGASPSMATDEAATGIVYLDRNANGVRDADDPGLEGVLVSNGVDVVPTDASGRYRVPVVDDSVVFVIKPRGHRTAMNELNMPRNFYIHRPGGSPDADFLFKGTPPTGPLPASIDFPLHESPEPDRFSFLALGDPQAYTQEEMDWLARDTFAEIIDNDAWGASFGVSLGDLVGDDLDLFDHLNRIQAMPGIPWFNVYGNHDMNFMSPNDVDADETYTRVYGPPTQAFQFGPAHFIILDNVIWQGFDGRERDGSPRKGNYRGGLRDDQLAFVANYLEHVPKDELVVLMMHIPLDGEGVHRVPERGRLFEILSNHPHTMSLSGHTHFNEHWFFGSEDGYTPGTEHHHWNTGATSGSWYRGAPDERGIPHTMMRCGAPNGYSIVSIDGNRYRFRYKASSRPPEYQMDITAPTNVSLSDAGDGELIANVFAGSERSRVEYRIGEGAWTEMRRDLRPPPAYMAIKTAERSQTPPSGRRLPDPKPSTHIWVAPMPDGLTPGVHRIQVRHTDLFGQVDTASVLINLLQ